MRIPKKVIIFLGFFLIPPLLGSSALGANFPTRPVRIINPYAPGGSTDILARAFQKGFEEALGVKIVIESKPGGSTKVGVMEVKNAKPDGYTLLITSDSTWVSFYYSKLFDVKLWEVLTPIGNLTTEAGCLVEVRDESPFKTWADFVKAAKENPGKLTCGGSSAGGNPLFYNLQICKGAGIDVKHVPFTGSGPTLIALLGGHIDCRTATGPEAIPNIRAGKTRALAVSSDKRFKVLLPGVPNFDELGINIPPSVSRAIWGPPNMPSNIVNILSKAIEKATRESDFVKLVEGTLFFSPDFMPGPKMRETITSIDRKYGPAYIEAFK
jgi:tripartite-type tricarboxylate transporter receptor subunit TctC